MPDISKCPGDNCPMHNSCYRVTSEDDPNQTYFMKAPYTSLENGGISCDFYWYNEAEILDNKIESQMMEFLENTYGHGYKAGGSGHLGHINYKLFLAQLTSGDRAVIGYKQYIETEFSTTQYTRIDLLQFQESIVHLSRLKDDMERFEDDLGFD